MEFDLQIDNKKEVPFSVIRAFVQPIAGYDEIPRTVLYKAHLHQIRAFLDFANLEELSNEELIFQIQTA